jgi:arylsulfatase A-like enzyme
MPLRLFLAALICCGNYAIAFAADKPNIVFVLFDDMGWGQPQSYVPNSALRTPNLDRMARQGMRFTDAHSAAAVCTPTRYGVLTGRYPSRIGQFGVLTTYSPPLVPPTRLTVASLLKQNGYHTARTMQGNIDHGRSTRGTDQQNEVNFSLKVNKP